MVVVLISDFSFFFKYAEYKDIENVNHRKLPWDLMYYKHKIESVVGDQFNVAWVQEYKTGNEVLSHQDPANVLNVVPVATFGDFEGGIYTVDGHSFPVEQGDLLLLRGKLDGTEMPFHSVSPITKGIRYSFILNRIIE
eukprot:TRINITY_DN1565_c0_g1_i3.p1 TRINITY_DN1565_c0_g1~~TRINITY_DN1565_c0_g1_i3.p1  ORF type:complete len:138 (+),score=22.96 TRINITY_DN1565_c0_g1_i3:533-946(+)